MAAITATEGRYLGGRPPYGYRVADAGPHPNPSKAADGKRLHRLEPDPKTAAVVQRIFAEYLAGRGRFAAQPIPAHQLGRLLAAYLRDEPRLPALENFVPLDPREKVRVR